MNRNHSIRLEVSLADQALRVLGPQGEIRRYEISTASQGSGQRQNSGCTPVGKHRIRLKIGDGQPLGAVFVGRRPTGEVYSTSLGEQYPNRDWILTRILWLTGVEPGFNRGGNVDTLRRYIYIHGTPDSEPMGRPRSHGCVRMRNVDLLELFDLVLNGTPVDIFEDSFCER